MSSPIRSHGYSFIIGGEEVGIMKISGLSIPGVEQILYKDGVHATASMPLGEQVQDIVIRVVRGFKPDDTFFRDWNTLRDWRTGQIQVRDPDAWVSEPVLTFDFLARPKALFFSDLDAGSNQLFLENLQLTLSNVVVV